MEQTLGAGTERAPAEGGGPPGARPLPASPGLSQAERGLEESQLRVGLRVVSQVDSGLGVHLLGVDPRRVSQPEQPLHRLPSLAASSQPSQGLHQPEGAEEECTCLAAPAACLS